MKIFIFFGFSSDSILDKVKDTIKYLNSQEKTHKNIVIYYIFPQDWCCCSLASQRDKETKRHLVFS